MTTLFISDLHLDAGSPEIGEQFIAFLNGDAADADALYILGDLFEAWIGDDDDDHYVLKIQSELRAYADRGVPLYFMRGNRDFLIGKGFSERSGCQLLDDPYEINLYGHKVIIAHGDRYCTDDLEYQAFRNQSRHPEWQEKMLALTLDQRRAIASQARAESIAATGRKNAEVMDVNADAVVDAFSGSDARILLHGHTHRPAVHRIPYEGSHATRIVLGAWYDHGSVLRWDADGYRLAVIQRKRI